MIWVWPQDLLASRLIAVMLLTMAGAALYSLRHAYLARTTLATLLLYGIGVVAAGLWNLTAGKAVPVAYVATFTVLAILSAMLLATGVSALTQCAASHRSMNYAKPLMKIIALQAFGCWSQVTDWTYVKVAAG